MPYLPSHIRAALGCASIIASLQVMGALRWSPASRQPLETLARIPGVHRPRLVSSALHLTENIMKTCSYLIITLIALGTTLPATAGPDFIAIEQARKARKAAQVQPQMPPQGDIYKALPPTTAGPGNCPPKTLVLPLDHGPRADTTPYMNQLRKERHAAAAEACRLRQRQVS